MSTQALKGQFKDKAVAAGAEVITVDSFAAAASHIAAQITGSVLLPKLSGSNFQPLTDALRNQGTQVIIGQLREAAASAEAGITGANFAIAETGTLVIESTAEDIRLASTLPEKHFVLLNPAKIIADAMDAVPLLRRFHESQPRNYLAYITGPSRTADIERVLTIGVHGPKELHILLCEQLSDDPLCM